MSLSRIKEHTRLFNKISLLWMLSLFLSCSLKILFSYQEVSGFFFLLKFRLGEETDFNFRIQRIQKIWIMLHPDAQFHKKKKLSCLLEIECDNISTGILLDWEVQVGRLWWCFAKEMMEVPPLGQLMLGWPGPWEHVFKRPYAGKRYKNDFMRLLSLEFLCFYCQ